MLLALLHGITWEWYKVPGTVIQNVRIFDKVEDRGIYEYKVCRFLTNSKIGAYMKIKYADDVINLINHCDNKRLLLWFRNRCLFISWENNLLLRCSLAAEEQQTLDVSVTNHHWKLNLNRTTRQNVFLKFFLYFFRSVLSNVSMMKHIYSISINIEPAPIRICRSEHGRVKPVPQTSQKIFTAP